MHFSHNDNKISVKKQMNQLCKVHKELGREGGGGPDGTVSTNQEVSY